MASPPIDGPPAEPRLSTTIALLRDGDEGLEVFTVTRNRNIKFASGALVFPGGRLDEEDKDPALHAHCSGIEGLEPWQVALRICGIRETFEEAGIFLARAEGSVELLDGGRTDDLVGRYRDDLHDGKIGIGEIAGREKLVLACDTLVRFGHWITPEIFPKRFDTQFFMARAPASQLGDHDRIESVDSDWLTPTQALQDERDRTRRIVFATRVILGRMGESKNVDQAIQAARETPVYTVLPVVSPLEGGGRIFRIPIEAGYGITEIHESVDALVGVIPKGS